MTVFKVHISYFKDFDRNFQNNYYFVLFPSIQFLTNSRQLRLTLGCVSQRQPTYNTISNLLSQAFLQSFLKFFNLFSKLFSERLTVPFARPDPFGSLTVPRFIGEVILIIY